MTTDDIRARSHAVNEFVRRFGEPPSMVARAPGRVNLIGEHTDYNEGFVLPVAIDRSVWIAFRPLPSAHVQVESFEFGSAGGFSVDAAMERGSGWVEYVKGVAWSLRREGVALAGWQGVVAGNVPVGAGLSSSAALELAVARVFVSLTDRPWDPFLMARVAQRAENEWVGVNCGIMDQLASASGQRGHALLIDCRSLQTRAVPIPAGASIVVLDTATRRGLVDSAYNERRAQCDRAARELGVSALRDVNETELAARASALEPVIRKRARHIVTENARTVRAAEALEVGDVATVGHLMNASHASLRDDFAVSSGPLDAMARLAQAATGCYGARMTGAGFGGCAVALVATERVDQFVAEVGRAYAAETGLTPALHVCVAAAGASIETGVARDGIASQ